MKYSREEISRVLHLLDELGSIKKVMDILGYPESRETIYRWLKSRSKHHPQCKKNSFGTQFKPRIRFASPEGIRSCLEKGYSVELAAEKLGCSTATIYKWRKIIQQEGAPITMKTNKPTSKKSDKDPSSKEVEAMKAQMHQMQLEIDILRETINVLKKDPGIDLTTLRNSEKAVIVDALRNKYSLPELLEKLGLSRSSYYYIQKIKTAQNKYLALIARIKEIFHENMSRYGYRRIHLQLRQEGIIVSEKVVRRIMKNAGLVVLLKSKRKYNSYKGEISAAVPNIIDRNFHASAPNQKWLTDITEFSIPAGKVYLSPIIDCFDGLPVSWKIGLSPDAKLVNSMLDDAISLLNKNERPIVHSDRGCHYRWPGWIERMRQANLTRSMSKKGCSPDNSACEGFFGRLKNEMFYGRSWKDTSLVDFMTELDTYIKWYREKRIKISLGGKSPLDYRRSLGMVA